MISYKDKRDKENQMTAIIFAISSWILFFSTCYVRNGRTYFGIHLVQFIVYLILGSLNALVDYLYYAQPLELYYPNNVRDNTLKLKMHEFLRFIVMTFSCTGIWQCVLLPMSGLGLVEYFFVFILLAFMCYNYKSALNISNKKSKYIIFVKSPISLLIFQVALFFIKVFSWFAPENFYRTLVEGNDTIRWVLAIIIAMFLLSGILLLRRKLLPTKKENMMTSNKFIDKLGKILGSLVSSAINFIMTLFSGPIIVFVIIGVICTIGVIGVDSIKEDLLKPVEKILEGTLSTGKYQVQQTSTVVLCHIGAFILYCLYLFILPHKYNEADKDIYIGDFKAELKDLPENERNHVLKKYESYFIENNKDFIYNYRAYKQRALLESKQEKE